MEGPSLYLAAEQLQPFIGQRVNKVEGNTKIGKERVLDLSVIDIFSYGKYLFFQFNTFGLRVHFLLWGSFEATVEQIKVTGDYPKKARVPRFSMVFDNGHIEMYSCSCHFIEGSNLKEQCDFSIDVMSPEWDETQALSKVKKLPKSEIGDVLLDQAIFMGVGNIIRNEILLQAGLLPDRKIKDISPAKLKKLLKIMHEFVFQFLDWRRHFILRKHYRIYGQSVCKLCGGKVVRKNMGQRKRRTFYCPNCQK